jgi:hypothetical protein
MHHPGNGYRLALPAGQETHLGAHRRQIGLELPDDPVGFGGHGALIQETFPGQLAPHEQIRYHVTRRQQRQVLIDRSNPPIEGVARILNVRRLTPYQDFTPIRLVRPGNGFDQGGLAGTIVADQSHNLASANLNMGVIQRPNAAKSLFNVTRLEKGDFTDC